MALLIKMKPSETIFKYKEDGSFENAVHMCTGVGECRKMQGGTMCPSFKATREEEHSTRGRANALRLAMSGQLKDGLTNEESRRCPWIYVCPVKLVNRNVRVMWIWGN